MILIGISALLIIWITWLFIKNRKIRQSLSRIPGPNTVPMFGNALELTTNPETVYKTLIKWWEIYEKKTFKMFIGNEPFVVISTPEALETILISSTLIEKNNRYEFLEPWLGKGLLTSGGALWQTRRKIITPAFHFTILEQFVDVFNRNADVLVEKIGEIDKECDLNIHPLICRASLDSICESAMGVAINAQKSDCPYAKAVTEARWSLHIRMFSPFLSFGPLFKMNKRGKKYYKAIAVMHELVNKVIATRKHDLFDEAKFEEKYEHDSKRRIALLDLLLLSKDSEGNKLSDKDLRDEVNTFMFEGHDTTTSATSFAIYHLSKNPEIQKKILEEQRKILGDKFEKPFTIREANEMRYLECVIKESLRISPAVPMIGRLVTEDVILGDGTALAKGTNLTLAPFLMHRNSDLFPEPEKFDPDRFLPENQVGMNPYAYLPFSAGPRNCVGQKYALLEMKCFLAKLLQSYEVTESPGFEPRLTADIVLNSSNGIIVRFKNRINK